MLRAGSSILPDRVKAGIAAVTMENDQIYYQRRAKQQLAIANAATDPAIKAIHLDLAARYVTLSELEAQNHPNNVPNSMATMEVAVGR